MYLYYVIDRIVICPGISRISDRRVTEERRSSRKSDAQVLVEITYSHLLALFENFICDIIVSYF